MEFTKEHIEDIGLSEEQVTKLTAITNDNELTLQKEWGGKANENAQKIIDGAISPVIELTKIEREKGEKAADYLKKAGYYDISVDLSLDKTTCIYNSIIISFHNVIPNWKLANINKNSS